MLKDGGLEAGKADMSVREDGDKDVGTYMKVWSRGRDDPSPSPRYRVH